MVEENELTHDLAVGISSLDRTSSDTGKPTTLQSGFSRDKTSFLEEGMLLEMGSNIKKAGSQIEVLREMVVDWEINRDKQVKAYQTLRYQVQLEIWESRGLQRCTKCYELDSSEEKFGQTGTQLGFGLVSKEDAAFILLTYTTNGRPRHNRLTTHCEAHCLCPACYDNTRGLCALIKNHAMVDLDDAVVGKINRILKEPDFIEKGSKKLMSILKCEPRIFWYNLPIPERAYEIGEEF